MRKLVVIKVSQSTLRTKDPVVKSQNYGHNPVVLRFLVLHPTSPTPHQSYASTVLQPSSPTCHQSYSPVVLHLISPTVQQTFGSTVLQPSSPTRQQYYSPVLLSVNSPTAHQSYISIVLQPSSPTTQYFQIVMILDSKRFYLLFVIVFTYKSKVYILDLKYHVEMIASKNSSSLYQKDCKLDCLYVGLVSCRTNEMQD